MRGKTHIVRMTTVESNRVSKAYGITDGSFLKNSSFNMQQYIKDMSLAFCKDAYACMLQIISVYSNQHNKFLMQEINVRNTILKFFNNPIPLYSDILKNNGSIKKDVIDAIYNKVVGCNEYLHYRKKITAYEAANASNSYRNFRFDFEEFIRNSHFYEQFANDGNWRNTHHNTHNNQNTNHLVRHFNTLGCSTHTLDAAKKAYRNLAKKYHPDVVGTGSATKFREIHEAMEAIKSSLK